MSTEQSNTSCDQKCNSKDAKCDQMLKCNERYPDYNEKPFQTNNQPRIILGPNIGHLFTEIYMRYGILTPPKSHVYEQGVYPFSNKLAGQPKITSINSMRDLEAIVQRFHETQANLELFKDPRLSPPTLGTTDPTDNSPYFHIENGSTTIMAQLVNGFSVTYPAIHFIVVTKIPYYDGIQLAIQVTPPTLTYPNVTFLPINSAADVPILGPNDMLIEWVTSPNNPDGKFNAPITNARIIFADFVFAAYSVGPNADGYIPQNLQWVRQARAAGKTLLTYGSASKAFGREGFRVGYMWYPIYDSLFTPTVADNMFNFEDIINSGSSLKGAEEFANLLTTLLETPNCGILLQKDVNESVKRRYDLLALELLTKYPGTLVQSVRGMHVFLAKHPNPTVNFRNLILTDTNVRGNTGDNYGLTNDYVRINLTNFSLDFATFLNRLAGYPKYSLNDTLVFSECVCNEKLIQNENKVFCTPQTTTYYVNPDDCQIYVDAKYGPVTIIFPDFNDLSSSKVITVERIDKESNNKVVLVSKYFKYELNCKGDKMNFQWFNQYYQIDNQKWIVV